MNNNVVAQLTLVSHDNDNMANIVYLDCIHTIRAYFCNSLFDSACVQKLHTLLLTLKGAITVTMNCPLNPLNVHKHWKIWYSMGFPCIIGLIISCHAS